MKKMNNLYTKGGLAAIAFGAYICYAYKDEKPMPKGYIEETGDDVTMKGLGTISIVAGVAGLAFGIFKK